MCVLGYNRLLSLTSIILEVGWGDGQHGNCCSSFLCRYLNGNSITSLVNGAFQGLDGSLGTLYVSTVMVCCAHGAVE